MMLLLLLLAVAHAAVAHAAAARPHILLMVLDDIGRTDTGIYGKSNVPMPNIVKLASEGAVLEHYYTQTVCSPTRSSLMVGRYPFRFGMQHPWTQGAGQAAGIPLDTPILPELLKKAGYETHAIGKWHCGYATWQHTPFYRGFSSYLGYLQAQTDYRKHNLGIYPDGLAQTLLDGLDFWRDDKPMWEAVGQYSLDLYDAELSRVVKAYSSKHATPEERAAHPLFVYFAHQTVHIPLQPRKDEVERCGKIKHKVRNVYCSMLVELDDSIGAMIKQYKDHGLWDNTLVLLTTDNGGMVNFDPDATTGYPNMPGSQGSNYPLRGSKTTLFDGGVRSLAFVSGGYFPKQHAGQRFKGLAHVVDITATALAAAQIFPLNREQLKLDGVDLLPLIKGSPLATPRSEVPINIVGAGTAYSAVRFGRYKLIVKDDPSVHGLFLFKSQTLVRARSYYDENGDLLEEMPDVSNKTLLYDIEEDAEERFDLADKHPELVQYGLELIESYVQGGQYMEPQGGESEVHPLAYPFAHGGVWKPWMKPKQWRKNFAKQQRAAGIKADDVVSAAEEEEEGEEEITVRIPQMPHF